MGGDHLLLESIDIASWYYLGVVGGLLFMSYYQYWLKHNKDPNLAFDKKYLVPFLVALGLSVIQLLLEVAGLPAPALFASPLEAFWAGFIVWAGVQEILKAILKLPSIDFFNTA
jgi:hypothetical protein